MPPAAPVLHLLRIHETQVGLMDQGCRLERLPGLLLGQLLRREAAQLIVDQRQQLIGSVRVALLDGRQDAGDLAHSRIARETSGSNAAPSTKHHTAVAWLEPVLASRIVSSGRHWSLGT